MKKYLVIGNPINQSLSPKLHNYWIKKNNIDAIYEKKELNEGDLKEIVSNVKNGKIDGINITIPFKKKIIPFIDELTPLADESQSVNTIYRERNKIIGHNTDIGGFELSLKNISYNVKNKTVFILGAGGVVPSIILAFKKMGVSKILISNRTKKKAEDLKKIFSNVQIINWGETPDFDMIINATSLGLKKDDKIELDYTKIGSDKFFYDIIYNPNKTNFLLKAKEYGNQIENGKMMFIYQASEAFTIWHKIIVNIDNEVKNLLKV